MRVLCFRLKATGVKIGVTSLSKVWGTIKIHDAGKSSRTPPSHPYRLQFIVRIYQNNVWPTGATRVGRSFIIPPRWTRRAVRGNCVIYQRGLLTINSCQRTTSARTTFTCAIRLRDTIEKNGMTIVRPLRRRTWDSVNVLWCIQIAVKWSGKEDVISLNALKIQYTNHSR